MLFLYLYKLITFAYIAYLYSYAEDFFNSSKIPPNSVPKMARKKIEAYHTNIVEYDTRVSYGILYHESLKIVIKEKLMYRYGSNSVTILFNIFSSIKYMTCRTKSKCMQRYASTLFFVLFQIEFCSRTVGITTITHEDQYYATTIHRSYSLSEI